MQLDAAGYIDVEVTSLAVAEAPIYWSPNRDAASIARSFWQKPIAAIVPATRVL
jgi:delta-aminolevulinic acid dehydratase/porphobilinogen synthase